MGNRVTLFKDEFEFKTVPFMVEVTVRDMYVNAENGSARGVNGYNAPTGMKEKPAEWVKCKCVVGTVRPDYPYTIDERWPENVDKHFQTVVALEKPEKSSGLIFSSYSSVKERDVDDVDSEEVAKKTIAKMKSAYENRREVKSLD